MNTIITIYVLVKLKIIVLWSKKDAFKTTVPFVTSNISAASGILKQFINCKVIIDFRKDIRRIHIFSKHYDEKEIKKDMYFKQKEGRPRTMI